MNECALIEALADALCDADAHVAACDPDDGESVREMLAELKAAAYGILKLLRVYERGAHGDEG